MTNPDSNIVEMQRWLRDRGDWKSNAEMLRYIADGLESGELDWARVIVTVQKDAENGATRTRNYYCDELHLNEIIGMLSIAHNVAVSP